MKVRIVEDSDMIAEMLSVVLTHDGHHVCVTDRDFDWLLAPASWEGIDAVLCDLWLGDDTTGLDVLRYVTTYHPHIRRVLLTAAALDEDLVGQAAEFADAVLRKPSELDDIVKALSR